MFLRGVTLVSKFALIFFLARFLEPADVGIYGLFFAVNGYLIYLIGLEFYTYSTREMLALNYSDWGAHLANQFSLYIFMYVLVIPISLYFFYLGFLPWSIFFWFIALMISEHLGQEINRLLINASMPFLGSIVLFVRSGLWCLVVILFMSFFEELRNLNFVFFVWLICSVLASLVGFYYLSKIVSIKNVAKLNIEWIFRGIRVAFPLLLASLAIRGIFTIDRFLIEDVAGVNVVAAYTLYIGIATAMLAFLDASIIVYAYPKLIRFYQSKKYDDFDSEIRTLYFFISIFSLLFFIGMFFCAGTVLSWIGKEEYLVNLSMLYWLLGGMFFYSLSMVPHLGLYAMGADRSIFNANVFSFVVFIFVFLIIKNYFTVFSVSIAILICFLMNFLWKFLAYSRARRCIEI